MRNDMLSIGEVARLKGVGVKALRYYERIGILLPAYVDPHTGYRYYAMHQMTEIDVIVSCVELDIPLKEVTAYRSAQGGLDIASLLERARVLAEERLRAAQATLATVDNFRTEVGIQERCRQAPGPYRRDLASGSLLLAPWMRTGFEAKAYTRVMTALYEYAKQQGLVPLFLQGMALLPTSAERAAGWHVLLAVRDADDGLALPTGAGVELASFPGGTYCGQRIAEGGFETCFESAFKRAADLEARRRPAFALEVWDAELRSDRFVVELLHPA